MWSDEFDPAPRARTGRLRRPLVLAVIATVLLVTVLQEVPRGATPLGPEDVRNQAGYGWCCGAQVVAASWSVPTITRFAHPSASEPSALEAFWIGVQSPTGPLFVQAGTQIVEQDGQGGYQAFWSDAALSGRPQFLGPVEPGDDVRFELQQLSSGGWIASYADLSHGYTHDVTVRVSRHYSDASAEWLDEAPLLLSAGHTTQVATMAETTTASMRDLDVNGSAPHSFAWSTEFHTSTDTYVPSRVVGNEFSILVTPRAGH